jgi:hypothetical protein
MQKVPALLESSGAAPLDHGMFAPRIRLVLLALAVNERIVQAWLAGNDRPRHEPGPGGRITLLGQHYWLKMNSLVFNSAQMMFS